MLAYSLRHRAKLLCSRLQVRKGPFKELIRPVAGVLPASMAQAHSRIDVAEPPLAGLTVSAQVDRRQQVASQPAEGRVVAAAEVGEGVAAPRVAVGVDGEAALPGEPEERFGLGVEVPVVAAAVADEHRGAAGAGVVGDEEVGRVDRGTRAKTSPGRRRRPARCASRPGRGVRPKLKRPITSSGSYSVFQRNVAGSKSARVAVAVVVAEVQRRREHGDDAEDVGWLIAMLAPEAAARDAEQGVGRLGAGRIVRGEERHHLEEEVVLEPAEPAVEVERVRA